MHCVMALQSRDVEAELRRVLCPQHWTLGMVFLARGVNRKMGRYNQQVADEYVTTVPGLGVRRWDGGKRQTKSLTL